MKGKIRVLVCDPIHEDGIAKLKQAGFEVTVNPKMSADELKAVVPEYDALIVRSSTKVREEVFQAGRRLKAVGRAGVGLDNIDVGAAEKKGVNVFNTPEAPAEAVAELAIGLIVSLARQIPLADRTMKEGKWIKKQLKGWELKGKTLGTIGLGNIGEKVSRIAKAFGMKILITDVRPLAPELLKELEGELVPLDELLQRSDIVTIHVPSTPQTHHMIGAEEFQKMKVGAFLVNTSRGAIVDGQALLDALLSGKLGGAALDVYEVEPPADLAFIKLPNVVATPHIGAQSWEAQRTAALLVAHKLIEALK